MISLEMLRNGAVTGILILHTGKISLLIQQVQAMEKKRLFGEAVGMIWVDLFVQVYAIKLLPTKPTKKQDFG